MMIDHKAVITDQIQWSRKVLYSDEFFNAPAAAQVLRLLAYVIQFGYYEVRASQ